MSAVFPSAVATALELLTAINNTKVTLTVNAGIADTTLTVDDASALPTSGYVTFDDNDSSPETISYTGKTATNLTGVTRAADGTTAGTHVANAHLEQRWNAAYHNTLATELIAVEQYLSDRFGITTNPVVPSTKALTLAATTNQLVLGNTNTTTISSTAPASSRTYTIPDAGGNVQFVMAGGTQTIAGAKTFSSALTINPATNQLVLGVTNTTTISATAPASSAIYTIPDVGTTASFILSAGTQTIGGAKTFSSAVTINPATNQIVLGVTNTVTINSVAPASSRTYTIPDAGGAASFVMTVGTQTISGAITHSGTLTMSSATIAMGGNKITGLAAATANGDAVRFEQVALNAAGYIIGSVVASSQVLDATAVTSSGTSFTSTNTTASITPKATTHKIRISITGTIKNTNVSSSNFVSIFRGSTDLSPGSGFTDTSALVTINPCAIVYVDSPASTSALTYTVKISSTQTGAAVWNPNGASAIILLEEIAA